MITTIWVFLRNCLYLFSSFQYQVQSNPIMYSYKIKQLILVKLPKYLRSLNQRFKHTISTIHETSSTLSSIVLNCSISFGLTFFKIVVLQSVNFCSASGTPALPTPARPTPVTRTRSLRWFSNQPLTGTVAILIAPNFTFLLDNYFE